MSDLNEQIRALCEARGFRFKPWEQHPAEVDDGPSPWPPGSAGHDSWGKAQRLRRQLVREIAEQEGRDAE